MIARMAQRYSSFGSLLLALALPLVGTSFVPSSALGAPRVPTHVACVGDSITYGYGSSNQATKSYPANLQTLFGASVQVKNFGRNAATMLSAPFGDLPYQDQPEYGAATSFVSNAGNGALVDVIIMLGANDSKNYNWAPSGKPKNDQQFLKDYRAMVEHFSALTPKPLVYLALPLATGTNPCCSIDGQVIAGEIIPLIEQLATEKNLPTIDLNTPTKGHPEYFGDGVPPTDAGYVIVAQLMHDGLLVDLSSASAGAGGGSLGSAGAGGSSGIAGDGGGGRSASGSSGMGSPGAAGRDAAAGAPGVTGGSSSAAAVGAGGAVAGASRNPAESSGVAGSKASGGGTSTLPPKSDSEGCSLSGAQSGAISPSVLGWLGLVLLAARRRRNRTRMC